MRELTALARDALEQGNAALGGGGASSSDRISTVSSVSSISTGGPSTMTGLERRASIAPSRMPSIPPSIPPPSRRGSSSSLQMSPSGRVKGTAIRTGFHWVTQKYGHEFIAQLIARSSPELQTMFRLDDPSFGVVASGWYDSVRVGELLELVEQAVGVDDGGESDAYNNALASAIAKDNVNGVYRSLFRLITTPQMLEANVQRVWRTYVDEGTLIASSPRNGELRFEIRLWTHHHPQLCRVVGFVIQHVLRAIGYEGLVIERTHCIAEGDSLCGFDGMYLPG
jgi:hypothetical protein